MVVPPERIELPAQTLQKSRSTNELWGQFVSLPCVHSGQRICHTTNTTLCGTFQAFSYPWCYPFLMVGRAGFEPTCRETRDGATIHRNRPYSAIFPMIGLASQPYEIVGYHSGQCEPASDTKNDDDDGQGTNYFFTHGPLLK